MGEADFVSWGITLNQFLDPPYNCFPSLHVGNSYIAAFGILAAGTSLGIFAMGWATLIAISTVVVRHHFFVDVVAGFAMSIALYLILIFPLRKREIKQEDLHRSRWWIVFSVMLYIAGILVAYVFFLSSF
jgi:membrane-associated phospholipid phosphatase